jgi:hypothetical protein
LELSSPGPFLRAARPQDDGYGFVILEALVRSLVDDLVQALTNRKPEARKLKRILEVLVMGMKYIHLSNWYEHIIPRFDPDDLNSSKPFRPVDGNDQPQVMHSLIGRLVLDIQFGLAKLDEEVTRALELPHQVLVADMINLLITKIRSFSFKQFCRGLT